MKKITTQHLRELAEANHTIIDTRNSLEVADGFLNGSLSIPYNNNFQSILQHLVSDKEKPIVIIADENNIQSISELIVQSGYKAEGYIDSKSIADQNLFNDLIIAIDPDEFLMDLPFDKELALVDLRSPDDFANGHVEGAINLPFSDLSDMTLVASLDDLKNIYLVAGTDDNSVTTATLLKKHGIHHIRFIAGGWEKLQLEKKLKIVK